MTEEQYKKAEQIRKEVSRNESVIKMLKQNKICDMGVTNLRITLNHIPEVYEAMVNVIEHENEKLLKQFEEL
nr:MAG TPA: hypothetical protein [Bacteriophage sp.]